METMGIYRKSQKYVGNHWYFWESKEYRKSCAAQVVAVVPVCIDCWPLAKQFAAATLRLSAQAPKTQVICHTPTAPHCNTWLT